MVPLSFCRRVFLSIAYHRDGRLEIVRIARSVVCTCTYARVISTMAFHMYGITCVARVIRLAIQAVANVKLVLEPSDGACSNSGDKKKKKSTRFHAWEWMKHRARDDFLGWRHEDAIND